MMWLLINLRLVLDIKVIDIKIQLLYLSLEVFYDKKSTDIISTTILNTPCLQVVKALKVWLY
jgi:hypothetical protein